ncbi:uncharacterized protein LTR77_002235 [Saxophila tyrrhenica]|uniref:ASST-domain-containing protein n=1 Tax=Saxophila tyrrhenica TaxID=1690608 RepID=A0AAV9PIK3_9PEZI|nr:hypothetical protein LTR77_002235 [Saxophila tyrrhenica]
MPKNQARICCAFVLSFAALAAGKAPADNGKPYDTTTIDSKAHYQVTTDTSRVVWPWRTYKTSSHNPPIMNITQHKGKLADGYVFISPVDSNKKDGTYDLSGTGFIMDTNGDLIFAADEDGMGFCDEWVAGMTDFRAQPYKGRQHITYWNGCNTLGAHWGHRWGRVTMMDEEYTKFDLNPDLGINTFEPATRGNIDVHEHQMTDRDTMVVTSYNNTQWDLTSMDGPADAWVADSMFFEVEVKTGKILFEWRALEHVPLKASHYGFHAAGAGVTKRVPWDWFHINSVQRVGEDYLISARHHFAVYLISGKDGSVLWKLDGLNGGTFGSIPAKFRWQHHARAHNVTKDGMTVSVFNNMVNGPKNEKTQTNGLAFWLSLPPKHDSPPVLVKKLQTQDEMLFTGTQGSYQMDVGNGNGFIGYGTVPVVREFGSDGKLLWQGQFGDYSAVMCYRGFKMEWHGTPKNWDPIALIENPRIHTPRVYASWNGATEITGWAVFAGKKKDSLKSIGVAKKEGFETVFKLDKKMKCVQVGAIRNGEIIRNSSISCIGDDAGSDAKYVQLQAENRRLQAEVDGLGNAAWEAYELFAEVAFGVIVVVLGVWALIFFRDRRRRRQYQSTCTSRNEHRITPCAANNKRSPTIIGFRATKVGHHPTSFSAFVTGPDFGEVVSDLHRGSVGEESDEEETTAQRAAPTDPSSSMALRA